MEGGTARRGEWEVEMERLGTGDGPAAHRAQLPPTCAQVARSHAHCESVHHLFELLFITAGPLKSCARGGGGGGGRVLWDTTTVAFRGKEPAFGKQEGSYFSP